MNEKYIPLYRKYRPQKLEEVVGQEHIKTALSNAISMNKISHAYLFTGPRGTGKTSTARIFAKSLNCVNGPTVTPCGECENCRDITNSVPMDVIEIDAASNRKVEDAQNILEKVMYAPVNSRFKIYIIDEVHMLSTTAFNALLKTLEEPPKNVIFILATTEVHKVLDTIKSRCQRFDFRRITTSDIVKHLRYISDSEKINITDDALATIAKNSAGGMRDSIALLDQLSVLGSENAITTDDINALLGRISFDVLKNLNEAILASNHASAVEILEKIYNSGNEPVQILQNLLSYFKNLLIVKNCKPEIAIELTQLNDMQIKELSEQAKKVETHQIISLTDKCANYIKDLKTTNNPRLWLEIAIIDLANLVENTKLEELQARLASIEGGNVQIARPATSLPQSNAPHAIPNVVKETLKKVQEPQQVSQKTQAQPQTVKTPVEVKPLQEVQNQQPQPPNQEKEDDFAPMPKAQASSGDDIDTLWKTLLSYVKMPANALLHQMGAPVKITKEEVIITMKNDIYIGQFTSGRKRDELQRAVDEMFGQQNTPITVRSPLPEDAKIREQASVKKSDTVVAQKTAPIPQPKKQQRESIPTLKDADEELGNSDDDSDTPQVQISKSNTPKRFEDMHSDNVNMVMDLFDGKIIE